MAACGSLQCFFENALPENPTPEHVASWNQINPMKPVELSSITEMLEDLHFIENPESPPTIPHQNPMRKIEEPPPIPHQIPLHKIEEKQSFYSLLVAGKNHNAGCFTPLNSESLHLCTEGLGFESSDEVESSSEGDDVWRNHDKVDTTNKHSLPNVDRSLSNCTDVIGAGSSSKGSRVSRSFPPPISCIGWRGKPCFSFRSYRHDGRFVLREIKMPNNEIFHASRENGCLKLHLVPPIEEMTNDNEDEEQEEKGDANEEEEEEEDAEEEKEMKSSATPEICNG